jgi:hypothetical protein
VQSKEFQVPENVIPVITDLDIPVQFRGDAMYSTRANAPQNFAAKVEEFKTWCAENKVFYYARPREAFNPWEAEELAREAGCTRLLMEDMS